MLGAKGFLRVERRTSGFRSIERAIRVAIRQLAVGIAVGYMAAQDRGRFAST